jgi:hypothetical protein
MADGIVEYILRLDDRTKAGTASATAGSRKLEQQTEATTRAVDDLGDETVQTGRQLTTMGRQSQTAGQGVGRFGGVLGGLKTRLAGVSASSVALGAALGAGALLGTVTAVAGAFQRMGQEIADARNDITDASTRSGIATETLEGLRLAAEGSGLSFSSLTSGLDQFGARLSQAAEGTGRTAEAFAALGVEVVDAQGNLRDGDAVLRETLASLNAMEPSAERSALAVEALGRTGGKLLQALSGTELEAFVALTREFGVGVGPDAARSAGEWQRATAELNTVLDGLKAELFDAVGGADALFQVTELLIYGFEGAAGAIDGFADGMASAVDRIRAPFDSLVAALDQLLTALQQIGTGDFSGGLFSMRNALEELTRASTETPAAIASALTAGVVEASFTAGMEGGRRATEEGGARVARLRELRADILTGGQAAPVNAGAGGATPETEAAAAAGEASAEAAARVFASGFQEDRARLSDVLAEGAANLAEQQAKTAAMAAETRAGRLEAAQTAIGVTGQALSGDLGGALSSAGGAAGLAGLGVAGAAVSGLQFIGEQGAKGISDTLDGLKAALLGALEALPELIGDVLPRFAVALVADLIPALIRAAPQILYSLVVELPKAIGEAIVDALSLNADKVERSEFLQNVVAVGSFLNPFATDEEKEARRAELTDRGDQSEVLGQRSRSASRTATDGQMGTARESDRLAMMSTRPRMTRATVKSNPFDDLARQYDVQYGEYGRARSTTIRPAAT